jgi:hypothetical protein
MEDVQIFGTNFMWRMDKIAHVHFKPFFFGPSYCVMPAWFELQNNAVGVALCYISKSYRLGGGAQPKKKIHI